MDLEIKNIIRIFATMKSNEYYINLIKDVLEGYHSKGKKLAFYWPRIGDSTIAQITDKVVANKWSWIFEVVDTSDNIEDVREKFRQMLANSPIPLTSKDKRSITDYFVNRLLTTCRAELHERYAGTSPNVQMKTYRADKKLDFYINGIPFDMKSTRIPKNWKESFRDSLINKKTLPNSEDIIAMVDWMYKEQGSGRYSAENKLFVMEVPNNPDDEGFNLTYKYPEQEQKLIKQFCDEFEHKPNQRWNDKANWRVIFLIENENGTLSMQSF